MEYETRELDLKDLQEKILRKCRKKVEPLPPHDATENNDYQKTEDIQEKDAFEIKTDEIIEEKQLVNILAEKRRKFTTKEEFIYLLYNDILPAFVTE